MVHSNPFFPNNNQNNENHGGQEEMMDLEAQVLCDTPEDRVPNVVEVELEPEEVLDIDRIAPLLSCSLVKNYTMLLKERTWQPEHDNRYKDAIAICR
ncbi:hypothetical protein OUZ56_003257 [Daphnia magna]|uniref:Uncharacterized protein n=1 Tax=Daphnia magna TaxID=35525 RepID=A0ABR0A8M8_9CRUS|nr:hypothetical protein OUZ56_003257 [Daphnia magna]